jgi:putative FmdB family regulatory protein
MLHDYRCNACNKDFEELVGSSEDPDDVPCPHCRAPRAERVALAVPTYSGCGEGSSGAGGCGFV